ncbi:MAG: PIN domain-containing protein [Desulfurococcales archaeon]|nr:PIN domain-containing protein [Desulfurococcales archaeon]
MNQLRGFYVLDASVLIEILAGNKLTVGLLDLIVAGDIEAYAVRLGLTEALYVTCRLWGWDKALQRMQILIDSGTITIIEDEQVWNYAAECKCEIPVSLGDCYTLATAKKYNLKPLFLKPEKELVKNLEKIKTWLGKVPEYLTTWRSSDTEKVNNRL